MDKIGGFMNKLTSSSGSSSANTAQQPPAAQQQQQQQQPAVDGQAPPPAGGAAAPAAGTAAPAGQTEDYGDKGLAFLSKKSGHNLTREQNEKITDGARGLYEKFSGKKIDPKYSN